MIMTSRSPLPRLGSHASLGSLTSQGGWFATNRLVWLGRHQSVDHERRLGGVGVTGEEGGLGRGRPKLGRQGARPVISTGTCRRACQAARSRRSIWITAGRPRMARPRNAVGEVAQLARYAQGREVVGERVGDGELRAQAGEAQVQDRGAHLGAEALTLVTLALEDPVLTSRRTAKSRPETPWVPTITPPRSATRFSDQSAGDHAPHWDSWDSGRCGPAPGAARRSRPPRTAERGHRGYPRRPGWPVRPARRGWAGASPAAGCAAASQTVASGSASCGRLSGRPRSVAPQ